MRVVVSSRFAVQVVDIETGSIHDLQINLNYLHFGITWNDDYFFLARRWHDRAGADVQVYDKELKLVDSIMGGHPEMVNVHQAQWWDNALWVCCPALPEGGNETILTYRDGAITEWYPFGGLGIRGVNSIFFESGHVYLIAHNRGPSWVLQYGYPGLQLQDRWQIGKEAHNVARWKDHLVILDSRGSCARIVWGWHFPLTGYPRGLAISDETIVVGQSYYLPERNSRLKDTAGGLFVLDNQWEMQQYHNLNKGHVYDVRFLDVPDHAHHGKPWTGRHGASIDLGQA